jgi:hypothetical protein
VEEDASGLTFQEWTPDVDTSRPPVAMLINSSELRAAGFKVLSKNLKYFKVPETSIQFIYSKRAMRAFDVYANHRHLPPG